jgi:hypothetical protein
VTWSAGFWFISGIFFIEVTNSCGAPKVNLEDRVVPQGFSVLNQHLAIADRRLRISLENDFLAMFQIGDRRRLIAE